MSNQEVGPDLFKLRMPEVDFPPKLEDISDKARKAAATDTTQSNNRHEVVVTPGRMVMLHPCPLPAP